MKEPLNQNPQGRWERHRQRKYREEHREKGYELKWGDESNS